MESLDAAVPVTIGFYFKFHIQNELVKNKNK